MIKTLALVAAVQAALVPIGIAPQLSARIAGDDYRMVVRPVDPIDPFRGAYVVLDYPGSNRQDPSARQVFVPLVDDGDGLWRMGRGSASRPDDGPYLSCTRTWEDVRCGIESWFVPQAEALELEQSLGEGGLVATISVDRRGNAAIVGLAPR